MDEIPVGIGSNRYYTLMEFLFQIKVFERQSLQNKNLIFLNSKNILNYEIKSHDY